MKANCFTIFLSSLVLVACSASKNVCKSIALTQEGGEVIVSLEYYEDGCSVAVETATPIVLRTLLMQGYFLEVHHSRKDSLIIKFPSAYDVSAKVSHHPGEVKATIREETEKRPDIRPLVRALNDTAVWLLKEGKEMALIRNHKVSLEHTTGVLTYQLVIPSTMISRRISYITLRSEPRKETLYGDEFSSQGFSKKSNEKREQPFGIDRKEDTSSERRAMELKFTF